LSFVHINKTDGKLKQNLTSLWGYFLFSTLFLNLHRKYHKSLYYAIVLLLLLQQLAIFEFVITMICFIIIIACYISYILI